MHALFHLLCKSGHVWKRRCSSFLSLGNVSTSNKYICFLLLSYYFFYLCIDINECDPAKELHRCSQTCINTEGSYNCSCTEGYELKKDGYECEGNCSHSATYPYQIEHDSQSPLLPEGSSSLLRIIYTLNFPWSNIDPLQQLLYISCYFCSLNLLLNQKISLNCYFSFFPLAFCSKMYWNCEEKFIFGHS